MCADAQSCLMLCDPMDYSLPGSSGHVLILQARILEWILFPSPGIFLTRGLELWSTLHGSISWLHCQKKKKWMQDVEMHRCGNRDAYFADQNVTFCYSLTPEQPCPQYLAQEGCFWFSCQSHCAFSQDLGADFLESGKGGERLFSCSPSMRVPASHSFFFFFFFKATLSLNLNWNSFLCRAV